MAAIKEQVQHGEHSYLIARQPIIDTDLQLQGYELLYRDAAERNTFSVSGEIATARVLSTSLSESGLDALVGDGVAFVNMTREAILKIDLLSLPPNRVIFEILEDVEIDSQLQNKIEKLIACGYRFALDDFALDGLHCDHVDLACLVKVDILALSREEVEQHVKFLRGYPVKLVAEKVETWEEFEYCKGLGFDLFQGYFFARPQLVSGKGLHQSRSATYRLISRLNDPSVGFDELEQLVSQDPALTFKLFRYVNSALVGRNRTFSNLRQVIILLGIDRLRAVASMFAMCRMEEKPAALTAMLLQRAQLCRLLAEKRRMNNAGDCFTVGMFSLIDAFMDRPIHEVLAGIPLPDDVRAAILSHDGEMGQILVQVLQMERRSCDQFDREANMQLEDYELYNEAAQWAVETLRLLEDVVN